MCVASTTEEAWTDLGTNSWTFAWDEVAKNKLANSVPAYAEIARERCLLTTVHGIARSVVHSRISAYFRLPRLSRHCVCNDDSCSCGVTSARTSLQ
jgi:hypothetical protein